MNNHTQQFAALQQCVHNFPSLSTLVRYMSSLLGRKNVRSDFSRAVYTMTRVLYVPTSCHVVYSETYGSTL